MQRKFYKLVVDGESPVEVSDGNHWESVKCPKYPGHQRPGRRTTDLHLEVRSKRPIPDFSRTMLSDIIVTQTALDKLVAANLTGFTVKSVIIEPLPKGMRPDMVPRLWEFIVTGSAGHAHERSGIVKLGSCDACGLMSYSAYENGIHVDETRYDGSDFFTVIEYPKHILINRHTKDVIQTGSMTNAEFLESTLVKWPDGVVRPSWHYS